MSFLRSLLLVLIALAALTGLVPDSDYVAEPQAGSTTLSETGGSLDGDTQASESPEGTTRAASFLAPHPGPDGSAGALARFTTRSPAPEDRPPA